MQTQIARLHPPPPVKSIIRRLLASLRPFIPRREQERGNGERGEGGAGGGIAFDSCYFSDWRGLAGKRTWYKGCAQQGWSVHARVSVCNAAAPSTAPELSVPRAVRAQGVGYGARGASLDHPKPLCSFVCQAPGDPCTLAHGCASYSSISRRPALP